jgi:hypothetical protein
VYPEVEYKKALRVRKANYGSSSLSVACESRGRGEVYPGLDAGTAAIRAKVIGAGGSLLMRSRHDRSEFMALACWNSIEDWQAFAAENDSAPPDPEAFRAMGAVSEHLSTEILEEVADLLDCGP